MRSKFVTLLSAGCLWVAAAILPAAVVPAHAETAQIRFAVGPSLTYLVFTVMASLR